MIIPSVLYRYIKYNEIFFILFIFFIELFNAFIPKVLAIFISNVIRYPDGYLMSVFGHSTKASLNMDRSKIHFILIEKR